MLTAVRRLPSGEALPAVGLLVVAALAIGPGPSFLGFTWLALVTPRLVAVDLAEHRLPDAIVLPGYPVVLTTVLLESWHAGTGPIAPALAGAACGLLFLLLHVVGGMGFGDVKLAPLLGMLTAIALPGGAVLWVVIAFLVGGAGAARILVRRGRGRRMAFGPPMLLSAWLVLAWT